MSDFNSLVQYTVENISRPVKYIIYKLTEFIRVVDKFIFRQVPAGAASGYATIEQIEGNTVKFNQVWSNGDFSSGTSGWACGNGTLSMNQDGSIRITSGVNNNSNFDLRRWGGFPINHKFYYKIIVKSPINTQINPNINNSSTKNFNLQENTKTICTFLGTSTEGSLNLYRVIYVTSEGVRTAGTYIDVYSCELIDLTAIFGAGNEPTTVADFESWLAQNIGTLPYYDYNSGELISCKMESVKSIGFNQWDEEYLPNKYIDSNGNIASYNGTSASKNYIKVNPNTTYYYYNQTWSNRRIAYYDAEQEFISALSLAGNGTFTTPSKCHYIRFHWLGTTYNHDICINFSDPLKNGTYEPYMTDSADIEVTTITGINQNTNVREVIFPNGMKQADYAGTVKDVLNLQSNTATIKCGIVDLGDLSWQKYTYNDNYVFFATIENLMPYASNVTPKLINYRYPIAAATSLASGTSNANAGKLMTRATYSTIMINDSSYTDSTTFKTAMNGIKLIYELATPITYTDLQDANGNPLNPRYKVEQGGTEQVLPVNTSTPTTVAPTLTTTYTKDVH